MKTKILFFLFVLLLSCKTPAPSIVVEPSHKYRIGDVVCLIQGVDEEVKYVVFSDAEVRALGVDRGFYRLRKIGVKNSITVTVKESVIFKCTE